MLHTEPSTDYRCPGERYAISRAVHLGRLARFYPGCRQCPHRDDIGTLSARQVARLVETQPRGASRPLFHTEGAGGLGSRDLTPQSARGLAAAFGQQVVLGRQCNCHPNNTASVVLAGDGRPLTAEFVAAAGEGLRWSGCPVVDIGPASTACLMFAVDHLHAAGGLLVGNPSAEPACVGLKFFAPGPCPVSAGPAMEPIERAYETGGDRPARAYGPLRRFQAQAAYLAGFTPCFHALRPLRFVLDSACAPLVECLTKLTSLVACEVLPRRTTRDALPQQVRDDAAHFAACVDGDGETCHFLDERGRAVPAERMALIIGRHLLESSRHTPCADNRVVGQVANLPGNRQVGNLPHGSDSLASASRAATFTAIRHEKAAFADGGDGRFWYSSGGLPLPDALRTISLLLAILSRSDRPFSEVLDREAPLE